MYIDRLSPQETVMAMLARDPFVTKEFLYRKCYPLFKSIYDRYYTDCSSCFEFINEIYLFIMVPLKSTGHSKLEAFGFKCSLTTWLKVVAENYCRQLYTRRGQFAPDSLDNDDRYYGKAESFEDKMLNLDMQDLQKMLGAMPNPRYGRLIEYRYIDDHSNEETAEMMGLTMANYYNTHKRAKQQFCDQLRKEGLI